MSKIKTQPLLLLLLLGFIWGTGYSIARYAMTNGVPPVGYSFWQSLGPAILITLLALKVSPVKTELTTSHLRYYLICALTGIVIPNTNMYFAAPHLPAGLLAVIVNTVPIIAYPMALLARVEKFDWYRFVAVCIAIVGLMLIIMPSSSLPSPDMIPWALAVLITPISFAFCAVYISRYRPANSDSTTIAAGTLILSTLLLLPLVIFTKSFYVFHMPLTLPDMVILLEIVLSSIGYILFFQLVKVAGPVYYSFVDTIVSLTGLMWGYIIFHEKLNQWTSSAVIFILLALILISRSKYKPPNLARLKK